MGIFSTKTSKKLSGTIWSKTPTQIQELCDAGKGPDLKSSIDVVKEFSGFQLLELYRNLDTIGLKTATRVMIKKWLDENGAHYFEWFLNHDVEWFSSANWIKVLGEGSFARTHLFMRKSLLTVLKLQKEESVDYDLREVAVLKSLCHKNILKMYEYGVENHRVWLLLEYANKGTLNTFIEGFKGTVIEDGILLDCFNQLFAALVYIHSKNVIHRDIKPSNIFLFKEKSRLVFKLGDFNLSRQLTMDQSSHATSHCGTLNTMAPEIISGESYRKNVDVWSMLCVILYTICLRIVNPISWNTNDLLKKIPKQYSSSYIVRLVEYTHQIDPNLRPSSLECLTFIQENDKRNVLPEIEQEDTGRTSNSSRTSFSSVDSDLSLRGYSLHIPNKPKTKKGSSQRSFCRASF